MGLRSCSHIYDQRDIELMIITGKNSSSSSMIPLGLDMVESLRGLMIPCGARWRISFNNRCGVRRPDHDGWSCSLADGHIGLHFAFSSSTLEGVGGRINTPSGYIWAPGATYANRLLKDGMIVYDG